MYFALTNELLHSFILGILKMMNECQFAYVFGGDVQVEGRQYFGGAIYCSKGSRKKVERQRSGLMLRKGTCLGSQ